MASKGMKIAEALKHLGVDKTADANDVKQAYRDLAKIWHPDRFQNDERVGKKAEAQIKIINEAKTVALTYIEKYGHFRHVRDEDAGAGMGFEPPKPPPRYRQQQERPRPRPRPEPEPEPEPEPPPKKEPPKPPPRPKEKPEPEPDIFAESMSFGDFLPGSTTLFVAAILIILVSFFFMLGSSLFNSPVERYKQYTEKSSSLAAARAEALKKEAEKQPQPKPVAKEASKTEVVVLDTFFTLGSDKEWVSTVQGPPLQIRGLEWRYGFSTVQFDGDKVVSWNSSELNPLKVGMILDPNKFYSDRYFGVGSKKDEVAAIQGAPDIIEPNKWSYGDAWVLFDSDTVVTWENDASIRLSIRY